MSDPNNPNEASGIRLPETDAEVKHLVLELEACEAAFLDRMSVSHYILFQTQAARGHRGI